MFFLVLQPLHILVVIIYVAHFLTFMLAIIKLRILPFFAALSRLARHENQFCLNQCLQILANVLSHLNIFDFLIVSQPVVTYNPGKEQVDCRVMMFHKTR